MNWSFSTEEETDWKESDNDDDIDEVVHQISYFPLFFTAYIFYLGSAVQISALYPFYPIFGVFFTIVICSLYGLLRSLHDGQCLKCALDKNQIGGLDLEGGGGVPILAVKPFTPQEVVRVDETTLSALQIFNQRWQNSGKIL